MKVQGLEIKDYNLETVEDMINALMTVPKGYTLHPLGQKCALAVNNYHECVHLDDPRWIDGYESDLKEEAAANGDAWEFDADENKLEPMCFGYVWTALPDTNEGVYSYYNSVETAKDEFDKLEKTEKTYGKAKFVNGKLEPFAVLGSTL